MRRLSNPVKRRIVEHLACFRSHAEVADLIAEEFEVILTPRHVRAYDPSSFQYAGSDRWIDYYELVKKRYSEEIGSIPIAQKVCRLVFLQKMFDQAMDRNDFRRAMRVLELAAKEAGCFYER